MYAALLLALGLSIDGLGVGLSYGLRNIRFTAISMLAIALCTVLVMAASMFFTNLMTDLLRYMPVSRLGAAVLFYLGGTQIWQTINNRKAKNSNQSIGLSKRTDNLFLLGNLIKILTKPSLADLDSSGTINLKESILLGAALSVDAFVAGIGAGFSGMSMSIVLLVGVCQITMINLGCLFTKRLTERFITKTQYLPGALLMTIALWKLF